jgi:uncharacterized membrane protein
MMPEGRIAPRGRAFSRFDPRRALVRFALSAVVGVVAALLAPSHVLWRFRAILGWDVGALVLCSLAWSIIARADAKETARRAGASDPGRAMIWVIALASSLVSLFAATSVLGKTRGFPPAEAAMWTTLTLAAVVLSWALTHTAYTLRYAHLYYHRGEPGGMEFPGGERPCDLDFAYFSFTIGMCFQVSDVTISSRRIRRGVLLHALISFIYNTTILALALNLAFGLLQS